MFKHTAEVAMQKNCWIDVLYFSYKERKWGNFCEINYDHLFPPGKKDDGPLC